MNATAQREAFAALVRQHQPVRSPKWQELIELRESISEARKKGASYETIRIYLGKTAVIVSADTVARFCHDVLGEPKASASKRRRPPPPRRNGVLRPGTERGSETPFPRIRELFVHPGLEPTALSP